MPDSYTKKLPLFLTREKDGSYLDLEEENQQLGFKPSEEPQKYGERMALCLSGGGIRSATFSLGVIQALAKLKWLNRFTYLSTVSGGGYIGSWLTSWMRRQGMGEVEKALAGDGDKPEAFEIRQLRSGSNYLSPTTGLSGDMLALVAIFLRNLLINWVSLIPLVVAVTLVPMINVAIAHDVINNPDRWRNGQGWFFVGTLICALTALIYTTTDQPNGTERQTVHNRFFLYAFLPVMVGSWLLSLVLANDRLVDVISSVYGGPLPSIGERPRLWVYLTMGASIHLVGIWLGRLVIHRRQYQPSLNRRGFQGEIAPRSPKEVTISFVAIVSGLAAGGIVYLMVGGAASAKAAVLASRYASAWSALYATFAVPALLLCFALGAALYLALARRNSDEGTREWWARAAGIWLATALVWVLAHGVCVLLPAALSKWGAAATAGVGTLGGVVVAIAGYKSRQTATTKAPSTGMLETFNIHMLDLLAVAFIAAMFVACALLIVGADVDLVQPQVPGKKFDAIVIFNEFMKGVNHMPWERAGIALGCVIFAWYFAWFAGVNAFSMHAMYGNRLARTFLGATRNPAPDKDTVADGIQRRPHAFTGFDPDDDVAMSDLDLAKTPRLFPVVNTALNIMRASGNHLEWQERKAASFTVTPFRTGSQVTGYCRTTSIGGRSTTEVVGQAEWEARAKASGQASAPRCETARGLTIGRAMTISGAAASPNMGYHSSKLIAIVMTFFNVRLGWWVPNPLRLERAQPEKLADLEKKFERTEPGHPLVSLLNEMFGNTTDRGSSVYLSDGGHFENLALYEMVRRRCPRIVLVDAGHDPDYKYEDLERAIRIIRNDLGANIRFPFGRPDAESIKSSKRLFTIARITFRDGSTGKILYIKPGMTGEEPIDVERYAARVKEIGEQFPHQSTADQFFDEPQFESYRALGQHALEPLQDVNKKWDSIEAIDAALEAELANAPAAAAAGAAAALLAGLPKADAQEEKKDGVSRLIDGLTGLLSWDKLPGLIAAGLGVTSAATIVTAPPAAPTTQEAPAPAPDAARAASVEAAPPQRTAAVQ